jgi:deoxyribose-phosphate aldolase
LTKRALSLNIKDKLTKIKEDIPMSIASYIDHTLLKPDATGEQIDRLCAEAKEYGFASVCVNPYYVARCVKNLKGTDVKVCTVVGFPLGATTMETKVFETLQAVASGAQEIDMVMNVCAMKSGHTKAIEQEIQALAAAVEDKAILKVTPHEIPEMDEKIAFSIPVESVYLFDADTEEVI